MNIPARKGINLMELLITLVITGFLLVGTTDMMGNLFKGHADFNNDVIAKQSKIISNERITSKIREASGIYNNGINLTIPTTGSAVTTVTTGTNSLAVFVPVFDSSGNIVKPSASTTSFMGIAFSIIPEEQWGTGSSGKYVLIETNYAVNLSTSSTDPILITASLPNSWPGGQSYLISKDLVPASLSTMGTQAFNVQGNLVNFAFVPTPKAIYFASPNGSKSIDDSQYLATVNFRNYRN